MDWGLGSLAGQPKEGLPLELQIRTARRRLSLSSSHPSHMEQVLMFIAGLRKG